jgi:hypothetical protein
MLFLEENTVAEQPELSPMRMRPLRMQWKTVGPVIPTKLDRKRELIITFWPIVIEPR